MRDLGDERSHHGRVELGAGAALELGGRLGLGRATPVLTRSPVSAANASATKTIRAPSGIASPREPVRVAASVPALVVVQHPAGDRVDAEPIEDARADLWMPLDHASLGLAERALLREELVGHGELAEVAEADGRPLGSICSRSSPRAPAARVARSVTRRDATSPSSPASTASIRLAAAR